MCRDEEPGDGLFPVRLEVAIAARFQACVTGPEAVRRSPVVWLLLFAILLSNLLERIRDTLHCVCERID